MIELGRPPCGGRELKCVFLNGHFRIFRRPPCGGRELKFSLNFFFQCLNDVDLRVEVVS